jgi:hypothetical protein
MNFSNKTLRNTLRAIHLIVGALVGAYIYSPLGNMEWFAVLVRASVLPALLISGLSMWQMPWLTKMLKRSSRSVQYDG